MIEQVLLFTDLLCHICIFVSAFYVVMHNHDLPLWHETGLWYVGLLCLFNAILIMIGYAFGEDFPMSYQILGHLTETILNISMALIAMTFLLITVKAGKGRRRKRK